MRNAKSKTFVDRLSSVPHFDSQPELEALVATHGESLALLQAVMVG